MANEFLVAIGGYLQERLEQDNNIINQGLVEIDVNSPFRQGGKTKESIFRVPIQNLSITRYFASATQEVTPGDIDDYKVVVPIVPDGWGLQSTDFVGTLQGTTGEAILEQYMRDSAIIIRRNAQADLKAVTDGAFAVGGALRNSHYSQTNLSENSGTFSLKVFTEFLTDTFGERKLGINGVVVSQKTADDLKLLGLASFKEGTSGGALTEGAFNVGLTGRMEQLAGLDIMVNDVMCAPETISESPAYPMYAVGGAPWAVEFQKDSKILEYLVANKGQGTWQRYIYSNWSPYIKGLSYKETSVTGFSDLATAANWERKWDSKNIRLTKYMVR